MPHPIITSVCSIKTKTLAKNILKPTPTERWFSSTCEEDLKTFLNESIKVFARTASRVIYSDWISEDPCPTVVEDGHKIIIGRDLFSSLGLVVVQQHAKKCKCFKNIDNPT